MGEKELLARIKKSLAKIAEKDPSWTLFMGKEELSAAAVLDRLDKDKKLRKMVVEGSIAMAIEMWNHEGRKHIEHAEGNSSTP